MDAVQRVPVPAGQNCPCATLLGAYGPAAILAGSSGGGARTCLSEGTTIV